MRPFEGPQPLSLRPGRGPARLGLNSESSWAAPPCGAHRCPPWLCCPPLPAVAPSAPPPHGPSPHPFRPSTSPVLGGDNSGLAPGTFAPMTSDLGPPCVALALSGPEDSPPASPLAPSLLPTRGPLGPQSRPRVHVGCRCVRRECAHVCMSMCVHLCMPVHSRSVRAVHLPACLAHTCALVCVSLRPERAGLRLGPCGLPSPVPRASGP